MSLIIIFNFFLLLIFSSFPPPPFFFRRCFIISMVGGHTIGGVCGRKLISTTDKLFLLSLSFDLKSVPWRVCVSLHFRLLCDFYASFMYSTGHNLGFVFGLLTIHRLRLRNRLIINPEKQTHLHRKPHSSHCSFPSIHINLQFIIITTANDGCYLLTGTHLHSPVSNRSKTVNQSQVNVTVDSFSADLTSATVQHLRPALTYSCSLRAENEIGMSEPSDSIQVTTKPEGEEIFF